MSEVAENISQYPWSFDSEAILLLLYVAVKVTYVLLDLG